MSEPRLDPPSDAQWLELLARASGDGRHFFTENQLYLAYARNKVKVTRYVARRGRIGLALIPIGLAVWIYALKVDWGITLVLGIACTLSGVAMVGTGVVTRREPAPREPVRQWLSHWLAEGDSQRLIAEPQLEADLAEYAPAEAACVIVVERDVLVDLLLKNGAHTELNALVVAESGYPSGLAERARRLLAEKPALKVIAIHDATPAGVAMLTRLHKSRVLPFADRTVVDAGLFPADITWLAELAPAIPTGYTQSVPLDSLTYDALLVGLRGVTEGALSLHAAIEERRSRGTLGHG